jgi:hypothetical protein
MCNWIRSIPVLALTVAAVTACGGSSGSSQSSAAQRTPAARLDPKTYMPGVIAAEKQLVLNARREDISAGAEEQADESAVASLSVPARMAAYAIDVAWDRDLVRLKQLPNSALASLIASYESGTREPGGSPRYAGPTVGLGSFLAGAGATLEAKFEKTEIRTFVDECERTTITSTELSETAPKCSVAGLSFGLYTAAPSPQAHRDCALALAAANALSFEGRKTSGTVVIRELSVLAGRVTALESTYPPYAPRFTSAANAAHLVLRDVVLRRVSHRDVAALNSVLGTVELECGLLPYAVSKH